MYNKLEGGHVGVFVKVLSIVGRLEAEEIFLDAERGLIGPNQSNDKNWVRVSV